MEEKRRWWAREVFDLLEEAATIVEEARRANDVLVLRGACDRVERAVYLMYTVSLFPRRIRSYSQAWWAYGELRRRFPDCEALVEGMLAFQRLRANRPSRSRREINASFDDFANWISTIRQMAETLFSRVGLRDLVRVAPLPTVK